MVRQILAKIQPWSPTTFIGYNTIDFDEQLIRQALYQTLYDPYITNKTGNRRGDAFHCVRAMSQAPLKA